LKIEHLLFLGVCLTAILSILSFTEFSYAQSQFFAKHLLNEDKPFIIVQTIVKNQDNQVVTYLTSNTFTNIDWEGLDTLLKSEASENDPIIIKDGKKFLIIKRQKTVIYGDSNVIASTLLAHSIEGKLNIVARFAHDGYPISEGEKVTTIWTFIKPID